MPRRSPQFGGPLQYLPRRPLQADLRAFPHAGSSNDISKIKERADALGVNYPVVVDNDEVLWNAYGTRTWPAFYGIDRQGNIRFAKFGGGNFESVIEAVQKLKEFG